jgi:hypothetical protein
VSGAHQQWQAPQRIQRKLVQQRRQERPIAWLKPGHLIAQLPLKQRDLMA